MSSLEFCSANEIHPDLVDVDVLDELLNIQSVADVLRSDLFHKENKASLLKLYKKAKTTKSERHWMTPATSKALIKARDTHSGQPFDACPLYLIHFVVTSSGQVQFQLKLRLFHSVMYDRVNGKLL